MPWRQDKLQSDPAISQLQENNLYSPWWSKKSWFPAITLWGLRSTTFLLPCAQQIVLAGNRSSGLSTPGVVTIIFLGFLALRDVTCQTSTFWNHCFVSTFQHVLTAKQRRKEWEFFSPQIRNAGFTRIKPRNTRCTLPWDPAINHKSIRWGAPGPLFPISIARLNLRSSYQVYLTQNRPFPTALFQFLWQNQYFSGRDEY